MRNISVINEGYTLMLILPSFKRSDDVTWRKGPQPFLSVYLNMYPSGAQIHNPKIQSHMLHGLSQPGTYLPV